MPFDSTCYNPRIVDCNIKSVHTTYLVSARASRNSGKIAHQITPFLLKLILPLYLSGRSFSLSHAPLWIATALPFQFKTGLPLLPGVVSMRYMRNGYSNSSAALCASDISVLFLIVVNWIIATFKISSVVSDSKGWLSLLISIGPSTICRDLAPCFSR